MLRVFEHGVLTEHVDLRETERDREGERERVTRAWKKLRNEVFRNLYSSPNTSRLIESKTM